MKHRNFNQLFFLGLLSCTWGVAATTDQTNTYKRATVERADHSSIVYYLSLPSEAIKEYPLVVLCEGSYSAAEPIKSVLRLHNIFLSLLEQSKIGLLTIEKWGVDGDQVNETVFDEHNTISQRIQDHQTILKVLEQNSLPGWNGKYIFIGGSEGGDVITSLTIVHADATLATINFAGIGAWGRKEEMWAFLQSIRNSSFFWKLIYWWQGLPRNRHEYDRIVATILFDPSAKKWWCGQTYRYMADAFSLKVNWDIFYNLKIPMLIIMGTKDSQLDSCDEFVAKGMARAMPITYWRLNGIGHDIKQDRPEILSDAISWLNSILKSSNI